MIDDINMVVASLNSLVLRGLHKAARREIGTAEGLETFTEHRTPNTPIPFPEHRTPDISTPTEVHLRWYEMIAAKARAYNAEQEKKGSSDRIIIWGIQTNYHVTAEQFEELKNAHPFLEMFDPRYVPR